MTKFVAVGAALLLGFVGAPGTAQADAPGTVEGRAFTLGTPAVAANRNTVAWGCAATVSGVQAATTTVTCTLIMKGAVVSTQSATSDGNAAVTTPVVTEVSFRGGVQYCWTAEAQLPDGTRISDSTFPNCI